jgi:hypothetical protein
MHTGALRAVFLPPQQLGQLGDVGGDAPDLVANAGSALIANIIHVGSGPLLTVPSQDRVMIRIVSAARA